MDIDGPEHRLPAAVIVSLVEPRIGCAACDRRVCVVGLVFTRNPSVAAVSLFSTNMKHRKTAEGFRFFKTACEFTSRSSLD